LDQDPHSITDVPMATRRHTCSVAGFSTSIVRSSARSSPSPVDVEREELAHAIDPAPAAGAAHRYPAIRRLWTAL
jgi:hypothetical protein